MKPFVRIFPRTVKLLERVVAPETPRVLAKVVAPVTPRVPPTVPLPLALKLVAASVFVPEFQLKCVASPVRFVPLLKITAPDVQLRDSHEHGMYVPAVEAAKSKTSWSPRVQGDGNPPPENLKSYRPESRYPNHNPFASEVAGLDFGVPELSE